MEAQTQKLNEITFTERYFAAVRDIGRISLNDKNTEYLEKLEKRRYNELISGLAEALPGIVRTEYQFELRYGRLTAEDGEPIEDLLLRAHESDLAMSDQDDFYAQFLPQRSRHELEELYEMEAMARGETDFNTIITFSPYSQEYDTSPENHKKLKKSKQMPHWKRAMVRVSHWDGHKLHMTTRSIDNSSLELLHETAKCCLRYEFQARNSTDTLGERIHLTTDSKMATLIPDTITRTADDVWAERFGSYWLQGRSADHARDMQNYVEANAEIIQNLLTVERQLARKCITFAEYKLAFDREIYDHIALLKQRVQARSHEPIISVATASAASGEISRVSGEVFSMCGYVIEPGSNEAQMAARTGFESLLRLIGKDIECPACEKKVMVPANKLREGRLACSRCGLEVDACTGKIYKKPKHKKQAFKFW